MKNVNQLLLNMVVCTTLAACGADSGSDVSEQDLTAGNPVTDLPGTTPDTDPDTTPVAPSNVRLLTKLIGAGRVLSTNAAVDCRMSDAEVGQAGVVVGPDRNVPHCVNHDVVNAAVPAQRGLRKQIGEAPPFVADAA